MISALCAVIAIAGCIATLCAALAVRSFGRIARSPVDTSSAGVTVLKPLRGAESGLYDNLLSFATQDYAGPVQILFGVVDAADAALPIVQRLMQAFPDRDFELVIGTRAARGNGKIANLVAMTAAIRHEIVVVAGSDIRVERDYLANTIGALQQPGVGLVTCLYRGEPARGPWALLASMAIDYHFLPTVLLGLRLNMARPCLGATIALSKRTLEAIGGFRAFSDFLADDYAIGAAVRATGQRVAVASHVVVHRCVEASAAELVAHELRWARTIRAIDPLGFAGSFITYPVAFALAATVLCGFDAVGNLALLAAVLCRLVLEWQVDHTLRITTPRSTRRWALGPVRDVLSFLVFCASFAMSTVMWRGHRYRIRADGTMKELKG